MADSSPRDATAQSAKPSLLADYSAAKLIPAEFLRDLGMTDISVSRLPAIRIPYRNTEGEEAAIRFRLSLSGAARFRWKKGSKPLLYGLWLLRRWKGSAHIVLVEGESDAQTLWQKGIPALGLPGASSWREEWADYLAEFQTVYAVIEPDSGGVAMRNWIAKSKIRDRIQLVNLSPFKDPSDLYLGNPDGFQAAWAQALANAKPWSELEAADALQRKGDAWSKCSELAAAPFILDEFASTVARLGVEGEQRAAKLLYLAGTSRLLDRPVSIAVKGPSSAGKSFVLEKTLECFPPSAFYQLSAMSERVLAYSEEPLEHRMLVLFEAAGIQSDFTSYLLRSLLSEGCLRYETTEKTSEGLRPRLIQRKGPTGLLVTTTALNLHPENETRLLSIPVDDSPGQTKAIMRRTARGSGKPVDVEHWHALQEWLACSDNRIVIPYAEILAEAIPEVAVRLRRDFRMLLQLIGAHALLHQESRARESSGQILATVEDYSVVRELVCDLFAEGVEATVPADVRETVAAVERLSTDQRKPTNRQVGEELSLDTSSAYRRVKKAIRLGYLRNEETQKNRPAQLTVGDPLPEDVEVLPTAARVSHCMLATIPEGSASPLPPEEVCAAFAIESSGTLPAMAPDMSRAAWEDFKERLAIMEVDGQLDRVVAARMAAERVRHQR